MTYEEQLAQYRQQFAMKEAQSQEEASVEQAPKAIWADEIEMPQMGPGMPMQEEVFAGDVNVPEILSDADPRFSGNQEADTQAFQEYMMNDPMMQQYGPEMEALVEELIAQATDPENPMTAEEAQKLFLEMMEEQFGEHFK